MLVAAGFSAERKLVCRLTWVWQSNTCTVIWFHNTFWRLCSPPLPGGHDPVSVLSTSCAQIHTHT